jgi:DNA-directed RNA polymerase specialized sigma24 family protein
MREPDEHPDDRRQRERVGVKGDPTPDHEYRDEPPAYEPPEPDLERVGYEARKLAENTALTHPQARVWLLRDRQGVSRADTAAALDLSVSTVDQQLGNARDKIEQAVYLTECKRGHGPPVDTDE